MYYLPIVKQCDIFTLIFSTEQNFRDRCPIGKREHRSGPRPGGRSTPGTPGPRASPGVGASNPRAGAEALQSGPHKVGIATVISILFIVNI